MDNKVELWAFQQAPEEWRRLSSNGGDEDFIVVAQPGNEAFAESVAERLEVCDKEKVTLPDGRTAWITCHA